MFANKFIGDLQDSRDLVQDVFLVLWEKADTIDIKLSPKTYLYQAVKNRCIDYSRHLNTKMNFQKKLAEQESQVYTSSKSPYHSLFELELDEKINELIDNMPEKCKEVYTLSRFKNLKNREISVKLGISIKMVEKYISKALIILRHGLQDYVNLFF